MIQEHQYLSNFLIDTQLAIFNNESNLQQEVEERREKEIKDFIIEPTVEAKVQSLPIPQNLKTLKDNIVFEDLDEESSNLNKETAVSTKTRKNTLETKEELTQSCHMSMKSYSGNFSTRSDVVRKSLIRSLKRFYTDLFIDGNSFISSFQSEEAITCFNKIDKVNLFQILFI